MFELASPLKELFRHLVPNYFDAAKGHCNWGHDGQHLLRVLASRKAWWPAIIADEPELDEQQLVIDLALLFHDLDRSKTFRGRSDGAKAYRENFATDLMWQHGVRDSIVYQVFHALALKPLPNDNLTKKPMARIVDDLDKADMGAVGLYRMAAVACDRKYGVFAHVRDFDPDAPAIEGDENLNSYAADICFCLEWWTKPHFAIATPAIRRMVEHRFEFMKASLAQLKREHEELGLI